jgi:hypothetical protein
MTKDTHQEKRFRIYGGGIYSRNQPRYATAKEARDDLKRYARSLDQSWLCFHVVEDLPDGSSRFA